MNKSGPGFCLLVSAFCLLLYASAQTTDGTLVPGKRMIQAVQFPFDQKVSFNLFPTGRLDGVEGSAEVRRRKTGIEVEVDLENAPPASALKPEYKGYVVWAVTRDGRFVNLGSLKGKGRREVTTKLPQFGIVISAEQDLAANTLGEPVLESGMPAAKRRIYPMHRVIYTPGVPEPAAR